MRINCELKLIFELILFPVESDDIEKLPKTLSDAEQNGHQKVPYPKRVFFIIANEFCERLNFLGMVSK